MSEEPEERKIHVRVSFPISKKGAYEAEDHRKTTVSTILAAAMEHFQVQDDSQFTYVLAFDGQEQAGSVEIGSLAGDHDKVRFTLVKKITQG